ncbi:GIY-YIG nuclease family protein [Clostridiisalibacter paucivorans]|uniref:GIY-YIG nuclease family protein n=1 Tax=Clostridiisalibacter paucivorans TaxID=408753 RepID=UPI000479C8BC|nr:GIY-YIG nuclease family protein [Clostridiisalibacter paucivorans]
MPYVYIVQCNDETLYTGWTTDIERRINEHNRGIGSKYTRARLPVELKHLEKYKTKKDAMKREWQIKKMSRKDKLNLIGTEK